MNFHASKVKENSLKAHVVYLHLRLLRFVSLLRQEGFEVNLSVHLEGVYSGKGHVSCPPP